MLEQLVGIPQLLLEHVRNTFFPAPSITHALVPIWPHILFEKRTNQRRNPGWRMYSVRHIGDRDLINCLAGKQFLPQGPRYFAMLAAYAVGRATHANCQGGEPERLVRVFAISTAEGNELFQIQTKFFRVCGSEG